VDEVALSMVSEESEESIGNQKVTRHLKIASHLHVPLGPAIDKTLSDIDRKYWTTHAMGFKLRKPVSRRHSIESAFL
jgi:hypothetical protein